MLRTTRLALVPLALALVVLAACKSEAGGASGSRLYTKWGCATCHGPAGAGGALGPPITDSDLYWDRASLAAFLADPRGGVAEDERLQALDAAYRTNMPPFPQLDPGELERIADFVLALE